MADTEIDLSTTGLETTLRPVIEAGRREFFREGYQDDKTDAEILGIILARFFGFDGFDVLSTAEAGLEDANFHTAAAKVAELRKAEEAESDRQLKAQAAAFASEDSEDQR